MGKEDNVSEDACLDPTRAASSSEEEVEEYLWFWKPDGSFICRVRWHDSV